MPREGISYEQVAAAADFLVGASQSPTIRAIRERIGTGSPNTIQRHLSAWRDARPQQAAAALNLSEALSAAIATEIAKAAAQARAEVESRLVEAQTEAAELAAAGELLEQERDTLAEQVASLTTERDSATATAIERAAEIERQSQDLNRERSATEAARIEVAQARNKLESQAEKITEQTQQIEQLRAQLDAQTKDRVDAEKLAAVLGAKLEASEQRAKTAEASTEEFKTQAQQAREAVSIEAQKGETKQNTIAVLTAKIDGLEGQLKQQVNELNGAKQGEKKALQEAAELRGKLVEKETQGMAVKALKPK